MKTNFLIHDDEYYYCLFRKNFKRIRKAKGWTQQAIALTVGVSRQYISDLENENRKKHISIAMIGKLADALHISIADFFQ